MDGLDIFGWAVPLHVVTLFVSLAFAYISALWFRRVRGIDVDSVLWRIAFFGYVAGRSIFVLRHSDIYFSEPWSILDIRDGGFDIPVGIVTSLIVAGELSRRSRVLRRPLITSTLLGLFIFFGATIAIEILMPLGQVVPAVQVRRLDGFGTVPLTHDFGQPMIINLWATWCPPCRREMPVFKAAQLAHPEIHFVFINQGESATTVQSYVDENGLNMQNIVLDPASQVSSRTGSSGYPTTLFYDARGRLSERHTGALSRAMLNEEIDALLKTN